MTPSAPGARPDEATPGPHQAAVPAVAAMHRGLRATGLFCGLLVGMGNLALLGTARLHAGDPLAPGLALVVLAVALAALALLTGWATRTALAVTLAPLLAGSLALVPLRTTIDPVNLWAPGYWGLPWVALALVALPRRHYLWLAPAPFVLVTIVDLAWLVSSGNATRVQLEPVVGLLSPVAVLLLFCDGLLQLARDADATTVRRERAERARRDEQLRAEQDREVARLVHAHVLHALHALATTAEHVPDALVAEECRAAVRAVDQHRQPAGSSSVSDDGPGFVPAQVDPRRLGLRKSVVARMEQVGGRATVDSRPGEGTRLVLAWPDPDPVEPPTLEATAQQVRRVLTRTAWPNLLLAPVFTLLLHPLVSPAWPVAAACALVLAVGAWEVYRLAVRPLTTGDVVLLALTSLVVFGANLWVVPDDIDVVHGLWLAWACTALAHLVVMQVRWQEGLAGLAVWVGVMFVLMEVRFGGHVDWVRLHPVLSVGTGEGLVALFAFHVGQRIVRRAAEQRRVEQLVERETSRLAARHEGEQQWGQLATSASMDLLRDVARGTARHGDPEVAQRAVLAEALLRDELVLGPRHTTLLDALAGLRRDGWSLRSQLTGGLGDDLLDRAARLAARLGPPARPGQQVVLSALAGRATAVVLDPAPGQDARWADLGEVVTADGFTRIAVPVPERPAHLAPLQ